MVHGYRIPRSFLSFCPLSHLSSSLLLSRSLVVQDHLWFKVVVGAPDVVSAFLAAESGKGGQSLFLLSGVPLWLASH